jgi:hypothetical protein
MLRGRIKVMIGRGGPRIQEETSDSIKIYSLEEWNKKRALENKEQIEVASEKTDGENLGSVEKKPKAKKKPKGDN